MPGGVEHIGRESTWQGKYDDEYSMDELKAMRYDSLYNIVKKYPPRHTYLSDKYWYESLSDEEFKSKYNIRINPDFNMDKLLNEYPIDDVSSDISKDNSDIIAFNYLWPTYGLAFLENSIKSVLPYVKKYILFLNKYSYIGEEASDDVVSYIHEICSKFDKVEIRYNASAEHPESAKIDNIGHYFAVAATFAETNKAQYVWLVQTDEVYDDENIQKIIKRITNGDMKGKATVLQPLCYIDNPHWVVTPPEEFHRPTIIDVSSIVGASYNYKNVPSQMMTDIKFHHLSQVLRRYEFDAKYKNWGHRDNVAANLNDYRQLMDTHKTNKSLINLHPIQPDLYKGVQFVNEQINKDLFYQWVNYLLMVNNPYDSISSFFEDTVTEFPTKPDKQFTLSVSERRMVTSLVTEFIPARGLVAEYGSWNGYSSLLMGMTNPNMTLFAADNYGKPDKLFAQYGEMMDHVYRLAIKKCIDFNLRNVYLYNGNTKIFSILKNDSLDMVFLHNGINSDNVRNAIIECWPKIKHCGIICGLYSINDDIKKMLHEVIDRDTQVTCPWGQQTFNFYELYYDLLTDVQKNTNEDLSPQFGFWFARVNKFN